MMTVTLPAEVPTRNFKIVTFQTSVRVSLFLAALSVINLSGAFAGESYEACLQSEINPVSATCAANDVRVIAIELVGLPVACDAGAKVLVDVQLTAESSLDRFDIGFWINQAGLSALSDSLPNCYRDALQPLASPPSTCNHANTLGVLSYYDADADACGDLYASGTNPCETAVLQPCSEGGGTCALTRRNMTVELTCTDSDGDGTVDTGICASWDTTSDAEDCSTVLDAQPAIGSKCNCADNVPIVNLTTEPFFLDGFEPE